MAKVGKWITGGLGWAIFGPIGGILGFVVGSITDALIDPQTDSQRSLETTQGGYIMSLLVLVAAVMKADGKILKSELEYTKQFFVNSFGVSAAQEAMLILRDLLKQNIPVTDVCHQIRQNMDQPSRLQLLHFLFGIAASDGDIHESEHTLIRHIAEQMGISQKEYESIESMFVANTDAAYKILEVDPSATEEELKKAYRQMVLKYHPDKVLYLGEDVQKAAKEKFLKVSEAWDVIKKQRGIV
jgi:DnaJ like chaperone protein